MRPIIHAFLAIAVLTIGSLPLAAQDAQDAPQPEAGPEQALPERVGPMTRARLWAIVQAIDPEAQQRGSMMQFNVEDVPVLIVSDPAADRMRTLVPIRSTEAMSAEEFRRVLEANFDTALDARYAVARGQLWATFIHPLGALDEAQVLSGIGQTVNIALSYGDTYSSGGMVFGYGDTADRQRKLLLDLLRKGEEL